MSEKKEFTGKEFYGKDNPIREAFKPILPFVVPHMVFPMENFEERITELQQILGERLELQSLTDENVPTDFYNNDDEYVQWKNNLFNVFFSKEIELISKAWFDWCIDVKDYSDGIATIFMSGACSGCSSSSLTLHMGIEQLLKHYIPEVKSVIGEEDPNSTVDPYYT